MTREEHLMTVAIEECSEVAQRVSKALRFGLEQVQQDADDSPEQNPDRKTNRERIHEEWCHLVAMMRMIGVPCATIAAMKAKQQKVERYLLRSARCGTLESPPSAVAVDPVAQP